MNVNGGRDGKIISAAPRLRLFRIPDSMQVIRSNTDVTTYVFATNLRRTCDYHIPWSFLASDGLWLRPSPCDETDTSRYCNTAAFGPSPDRCGGRRLTGLLLTEISPDADTLYNTPFDLYDTVSFENYSEKGKKIVSVSLILVNAPSP